MLVYVGFLFEGGGGVMVGTFFRNTFKLQILYLTLTSWLMSLMLQFAKRDA